jgi:hypothetical protein
LLPCQKMPAVHWMDEMRIALRNTGMWPKTTGKMRTWSRDLEDSHL